jgi:hypothetical protein
MKKLIKIVKSLKGSLILIGVDDLNVNDAIKQNKNLVSVDILSDLTNNKISNESFNNEELNIRDFKKHFKKNKHETIICNYKQVSKFLNYFVKDSIYISKDKIYIIFKNKEELQLIKQRYKRYTKDFILHDDIIEINVMNSKNNIIKDSFYFINDSIYNLIELASETVLK